MRLTPHGRHAERSVKVLLSKAVSAPRTNYYTISTYHHHIRLAHAIIYLLPAWQCTLRHERGRPMSRPSAAAVNADVVPMLSEQAAQHDIAGFQFALFDTSTRGEPHLIYTAAAGADASPALINTCIAVARVLILSESIGARVTTKHQHPAKAVRGVALLRRRVTIACAAHGKPDMHVLESIALSVFSGSPVLLEMLVDIIEPLAGPAAPSRS